MRSARLKVQWALALAAIAVIALPAAAPARAKPTCARPGSRTVAQNAVARLFTRPSNDALVGCWKKRGRAQSLSGPEGGCWLRAPPDLVRLRGRFATFYFHRTPYGPGSPASCVSPPEYDQHFIHVVDLDLGANKRYQIAARPAGNRLLLDARGAVAWPSWLPDNRVEIRVIDAVGSQNPGAGPFGLFGRVIDSGVIHPETVELTAAGELSWYKEGSGNGSGSQTAYLAPFNYFP